MWPACSEGARHCILIDMPEQNRLRHEGKVRLVPHAIGVLLLMSAGLVFGQRPMPVILDTDLGNDIDDEFALALAIQSQEIDEIGRAHV